ncbi:hypothetical protein Dalk_4558 [Desulfatibacillum aliphaticivorans]|uniref:Uncharacterized protein n=1 Tax=Desulfatibacillum aliphaticivorans TaxID=218208 RepID=B8FCS3_DESAL|nr:hypothetical protein [Desulfatibacillum aliphaticivorans]ACL06236.1 hypothetical protein Dalk_4558 [Desulfatibacillum aliphaticivorans]
MGIIKQNGTMYLAKEMRITSDKYRKGYDGIRWDGKDDEGQPNKNKENKNH